MHAAPRALALAQPPAVELRYAPLAMQVGDLKFLQPSDLDSFELPVIKRRKLEACIDGLKGTAGKEL